MSHYIRTIHTDYTSRVAPASLSAVQHVSSTRYPPGLEPADWRTYSSPASGAQQPAYTRRSRRSPASTSPSYRSSHSAPARRGTPPPSSPAIRTSYVKFDPFSDEDPLGPPPPSPVKLHYHFESAARDAHSPVLYRTPSKSYNAPTFTLRVPSTPPSPPPQPQPQPKPFDPNARSRLVAGILLNRVHAVGKPMRRRSFDGPKEYVKSGLSSVVSVEA
ncbi:hypothetical protein H0H92_005107 [Tricholoma furcatifolium]|nr:hypothetical protein H0H92_005107 [Tricholoma furcatifolium]